MEKLRLFYDSSQEEVDWFTLPEEQSRQRRLAPIRRARDSHMTVTMQQRPNLTSGKKTNTPNLIKNRPRLEKENRTENVLVLATELTNKIKKVEAMMKALQNKETESYPCVFTDFSVKRREIEKRKIRNVKNHTRGSSRKPNTNRINSEFNHI